MSAPAPPFARILIANRGEIAVRIARTCAELGVAAVGVRASDEAPPRWAAEVAVLPGTGARAYLDPAALVGAAMQAGCEAVHPGYGFLSEDAGFAQACSDADLTFIGPSTAVLARLGDKAAARALAAELDVPVLLGTAAGVDLASATAFFDARGGRAVMVKAAAGGGGRGMREVRAIAELAPALGRCASEAKAAFGSPDLYLERLVERARHVEVQVLGDGTTAVHAWERDCTLQRRHQKLVEVAPAPALDPALRERLLGWAVKMAEAVGYRGLCTMEFLLDLDAGQPVFIEANPRLQVEHTVTEAITGLDLVAVQLRLAAGARLAELGLSTPPPAQGTAVQFRVTTEALQPDGSLSFSGGVVTRFEPPGGPGVRVDTAAAAGTVADPSFDPLLAKLIVSAATWSALLRRSERALAEFRVEGVRTNLPLLRQAVRAPELEAYDVTTTLMESRLADWGKAAAEEAPSSTATAAPAAATRAAVAAPPGTEPASAPMAGRVVGFEVAVGDRVRRGQAVAILEAMKMEHPVAASAAGIVQALAAVPGEVVAEGAPLAFILPAEDAGEADEADAEVDLDHIRPDLAEVNARWLGVLDVGRPEAVARRRQRNRKTARENLDDLFDPGSFIEYGAFALAAQRRRRSTEELLRMSPADGMVSGIGTVNGALFGEEGGRCMGFAYDFTVFAGTQGHLNHRKKDRLFALAEQFRIPVVFLAEGGGGRPGDTDGTGVAGLDTPSFRAWAGLSGLVPRVGVTGGRCFAGNAAILGCADVVIATHDANIGMGGPAMIEGGGLGVFAPEEVGPVSELAPVGVVDVVAQDDADSIRIAKQYLSYFQGPVGEWSAADPRTLRRLIPENRLRAYDIRTVIHALCDTGSVLELRAAYGVGIVTALVRIEGRPVGLIANNPSHLGGAIDAPAAEKCARFLQLCDAFDLPVVSLCDTPGFMVGPEEERRAQVRRASSLFVTGATLSVPVFTIVLRKGYGLGAQAMAGGGFHEPFFVASWPTGEFGGMGLEGAVRLGYRRELEAIADEAARDAEYRKLVDRMYANGKATSMAAAFEIDAVIDPADTRTWILRGLKSLPPKPVRTERKRMVDAW